MRLKEHMVDVIEQGVTRITEIHEFDAQLKDKHYTQVLKPLEINAVIEGSVKRLKDLGLDDDYIQKIEWGV
jgi:hypothetical protein